MARKRKPQKKSKPSNLLRIIGGDWRSRKLTFIDAPGLRPTPDRIRETLFNWLQGKVYGSRCLDLYAGSGALGLEALSRGADNVVFIEKNKAVATQLKKNLETLNSNALVQPIDALTFLSENKNIVFDIIFLDPPYRQDLLKKTLDLIIQNKLIDTHSYIYLEHEAETHFNWKELGFKILKNTKAGQVNSVLLQLI